MDEIDKRKNMIENSKFLTMLGVIGGGLTLDVIYTSITGDMPLLSLQDPETYQQLGSSINFAESYLGAFGICTFKLCYDIIKSKNDLF